MGAGDHKAPDPPPRHLWQKVLNESWPQHDKRGTHARDVPHQPPEKHIPVTVRVVFERDGETWLEGTATRWTSRCVFVEIEDDERLQSPFVWVDAGDVRRRSAP